MGIMNFLKDFLKDKSYGFYVTLGLILLTVVSAIIYAAIFNVSRYMSWAVFVIMIIGAVIAGALPFIKQTKWACVVLAITDFVALLLYVYSIYFYVSIVMVGIQTSSFSWQFLLCTSLLAILLVGNIANVFLKQEKGDK